MTTIEYTDTTDFPTYARQLQELIDIGYAEFALVALQEATKKHPQILLTVEFREFAVKNEDALLSASDALAQRGEETIQ